MKVKLRHRRVGKMAYRVKALAVKPDDLSSNPHDLICILNVVFQPLQVCSHTHTHAHMHTCTHAYTHAQVHTQTKQRQTDREGEREVYLLVDPKSCQIDKVTHHTLPVHGEKGSSWFSRSKGERWGNRNCAGDILTPAALPKGLACS